MRQQKRLSCPCFYALMIEEGVFQACWSFQAAIDSICPLSQKGNNPPLQLLGTLNHPVSVCTSSQYYEGCSLDCCCCCWKALANFVPSQRRIQAKASCSGLHGLEGRPLTNCSWYSATAPDDAPKAPLLLLLAKSRQVLPRAGADGFAKKTHQRSKAFFLSSSAWYYTLLCPGDLKQAQRALTSTRECIWKTKKGIKKWNFQVLFSFTKLYRVSTQVLDNVSRLLKIQNCD